MSVSGFFFRLTMLLLLLVAGFTTKAQDVIFELNGNELRGQVIEISPTQVLYRPEGADPALPPTMLEKRALFMVKFANGARETFLPAAPASNPAGGVITSNDTTNLTPQELYRLGQRDALRLHNYKGAFWATYGATLTTGYGGLIAGGIIGSTRPKAVQNPLVPSQMLRYPSYVDGYETQARRRKMGKAAEGFGAGMGTALVILIAYLIILSQP